MVGFGCPQFTRCFSFFTLSLLYLDPVSIFTLSLWLEEGCSLCLLVYFFSVLKVSLMLFHCYISCPRSVLDASIEMLQSFLSGLGGARESCLFILSWAILAPKDLIEWLPDVDSWVQNQIRLRWYANTCSPWSLWIVNHRTHF
jgi:hypothetical protein